MLYKVVKLFKIKKYQIIQFYTPDDFNDPFPLT